MEASPVFISIPHVLEKEVLLTASCTAVPVHTGPDMSSNVPVTQGPWKGQVEPPAVAHLANFSCVLCIFAFCISKLAYEHISSEW